tara:strand:- start:926 stop:1222 length:297 start_codon:yes stop_codon:yes gene_type:complete
MAGAFLLTDLANFFDDNDFAQIATIGSASVKVVFDNAFFGQEVGGSVEIDEGIPVAHAITTDVVGVANGATIVIDSVAFTIVGREDDNTGVTMLRLRR